MLNVAGINSLMITIGNSPILRDAYSEPGTAEYYLSHSEYSQYFKFYSFFYEVFMDIVMGFIKILYAILKGVEDGVSSVYDLLSLGSVFRENDWSGVLGGLSMKAILYSIFVVALIIVGILFIVGSDKLKGSKVCRNIGVSVCVLILMPSALGVMNGIATSWKDVQLKASNDVATEVFLKNMYDITYIFKDSATVDTKLENKNINVYNALEEDVSEEIKSQLPENPVDYFSSIERIRTYTLSDSEMDKTELATKAAGSTEYDTPQTNIKSKILPDYSIFQITIKEHQGMRYVSTLKNPRFSFSGIHIDFWVFKPAYYRYHIDYLPIIALYIIMIVVYSFVIVRTARLMYELVIQQLIATVLAASDIAYGEKLKTALKEIFYTYITLMYCVTSLTIFNTFYGFVWNQGESGTAGEWGYVLKIIVTAAIALAVIDGPKIMQKIFGIDAGVQDGYGTLDRAMHMARPAAKVAEKAIGAMVAFPGKVSDFFKARQNPVDRATPTTPEGEGRGGTPLPKDPDNQNKDPNNPNDSKRNKEKENTPKPKDNQDKDSTADSGNGVGEGSSIEGSDFQAKRTKTASGNKRQLKLKKKGTQSDSLSTDVTKNGETQTNALKGDALKNAKTGTNTQGGVLKEAEKKEDSASEMTAQAKGAEAQATDAKKATGTKTQQKVDSPSATIASSQNKPATATKQNTDNKAQKSKNGQAASNDQPTNGAKTPKKDSAVAQAQEKSPLVAETPQDALEMAMKEASEAVLNEQMNGNIASSAVTNASKTGASAHEAPSNNRAGANTVSQKTQLGKQKTPSPSDTKVNQKVDAQAPSNGSAKELEAAQSVSARDVAQNGESLNMPSEATSQSTQKVANNTHAKVGSSNTVNGSAQGAANSVTVGQETHKRTSSNGSSAQVVTQRVEQEISAAQGVSNVSGPVKQGTSTVTSSGSGSQTVNTSGASVPIDSHGTSVGTETKSVDGGTTVITNGASGANETTTYHSVSTTGKRYGHHNGSTVIQQEVQEQETGGGSGGSNPTPPQGGSGGSGGPAPKSNQVYTFQDYANAFANDKGALKFGGTHTMGDVSTNPDHTFGQNVPSQSQMRTYFKEKGSPDGVKLITATYYDDNTGRTQTSTFMFQGDDAQAFNERLRLDGKQFQGNVKRFEGAHYTLTGVVLQDISFKTEEERKKDKKRPKNPK